MCAGDSEQDYAQMIQMSSGTGVYDNSLGRVGILYTMLKVKNIDGFVDKWISQTPNLDHCWFGQQI